MSVDRVREPLTAGSVSRLLLGLIGADIQASRSPAMHEAEAAAHGLRCVYQLIDLSRLHLTNDALPELLSAAERMGFAGLNITHPCKQAVMPLLHALSDSAAIVGAVNTVVFDQGKLVGHNTDWWGFRQGFRDRLPGASLDRVVQLGAGGAGAATAYAVLEMGAGELVIVDVLPDRARTLVARLSSTFPGRVRAEEELGQLLGSADGLIHATPTGMQGHPGLAVPEALLHPSFWVAEVVYFPLDTELVRAARRAGCRVVDGGGMAVYQAVGAFRLFTGLEPDVARMRATFDAAGAVSV
jgi:shikimate dehydrogenase